MLAILKKPRIGISLVSLFLPLLLLSSLAYAKAKEKFIIFYSNSCHRCIEIKERILPVIESKFSEFIDFDYKEISDIENYKLMLKLDKKYAANLKKDMPVFYFRGGFIPSEQIKNIESVENFINQRLQVSFKEEPLQDLDLVERFKKFNIFVVAGAGLIDGVNPCAFTVLIFFISFLLLQGYRKRELLLVGSSFILALFLTYILIGIGVFSFLYQLSSFRTITKIFNVSIGIFSLVLGFIALYDFFKYKKEGKTEDLVLQLPKKIKDKIHSIIGSFYRKDARKPSDKQTKLFYLIVSAFVCGFLITILEAVCTGQTYLPTISFILKTTTLKVSALAYLVLYNIMFVLPLILILGFAIAGVGTEQFSSFIKKHMLLIKILMAVVFFTFGIYLIWIN